MIRLIVQRHEVNCNSGEDSKSYFTFDIEHPEIESILSGGGRGQMGFDLRQVMGVEVVPVAAPKPESK